MGYAKIRPKRGTASQWENANPVLSEGEFAVEAPEDGVGKGACKLKIGDGATAWNSLPYAVDVETAVNDMGKLFLNHMTTTHDVLRADIRNAILEAHPVGSIYISVNDTNPGDLFGGEWARIQDAFLLAAGKTYAAGSTGGEAEHKLTAAEMPAHTHAQNVAVSDSTASNYMLVDANSGGGAKAKSAAQNVNTGSAGNGAAHNNMPPYLAVYVWKRTA